MSSSSRRSSSAVFEESILRMLPGTFLITVDLGGKGNNLSVQEAGVLRVYQALIPQLLMNDFQLFSFWHLQGSLFLKFQPSVFQRCSGSLGEEGKVMSPPGLVSGRLDSGHSRIYWTPCTYSLGGGATHWDWDIVAHCGAQSATLLPTRSSQFFSANRNLII